MTVIEIEGLTKDYFVGFWRKRPYRALDSLTLTVDQGEVFGAAIEWELRRVTTP